VDRKGKTAKKAKQGEKITDRKKKPDDPSGMVHCFGFHRNRLKSIEVLYYLSPDCGRTLFWRNELTSRKKQQSRKNRQCNEIDEYGFLASSAKNNIPRFALPLIGRWMLILSAALFFLKFSQKK